MPRYLAQLISRRWALVCKFVGRISLMLAQALSRGATPTQHQQSFILQRSTLPTAVAPCGTVSIVNA
jgi:hypothetical protein